MNYFDWLDINPDLDHILEFGVFQDEKFVKVLGYE